jgi:hypothetical protein
MRRVTAVAGAVVPPLVLAALGTSHPHVLSPESATWWRDLHVIGLVAFPLLALGPWLALRGRSRVLQGVVVALGLVYGAFYTALDAIAGIGGGATTLALGPGPWVSALFGVADQVVLPGVYAYLAASVLATVVLLLSVDGAARIAVIAGGVLAIGGAAVFLTSHIYWPVGVATMVALGAGWALLVLPGPPTGRSAATRQAEPSAVRSTASRT